MELLRRAVGEVCFFEHLCVSGVVLNESFDWALQNLCDGESGVKGGCV